MKLLLLGKDGQVGWQLQRALSVLGTLIAVGRTEVDLQKPSELVRIIRSVRPDVVVNAAAYTDVDRAEFEPEAAFLVNSEAVGAIAETVHEQAGWLVHYSTDYVFDGAKEGAYKEEDEPSPLNVYGRSKLAGEALIAASGCKHLLLRSEWVFDTRGSNFPLAILQRSLRHDLIEVVSDSVGAPTSAALIADVTSLLLYKLGALDEAEAERLCGTYHLSASGETSWFEYARFIVGVAQARRVPVRAGPDQIIPVLSGQYPTVAPRPRNCRLDTSKIRRAFGIHLPDWRAQVTRFVDEAILLNVLA